MAAYYAVLNKTYDGSATYFTTRIGYNSISGRFFYKDASDQSIYANDSIPIPIYTNGTKVFEGYYFGGYQVINASGRILRIPDDVQPYERWTDQWTTVALAASVSKGGGTGGTDYLYFNSADSKWYLNYPFATEFSAAHPITIPTKECYRFLGCYSKNNATSTKYINADGTPTSAFLALTPSNDITIYAQWELVSYEVTVSSLYGTYAYKTFYQSKTADGDGKYGYYTDSTCTESSRIYSIPVPTRELYAWGGLRSTSATTGVLYANADGSFTDAFKNLSAETRTVYGNFWTQVSYKLTLSGSGWTFNPAAYYTSKTIGGVYADWLCETTALDYVAIPVRVGYRFLGYKYSTTAVVDSNGLISDTLKNYKDARTLTVQGRAASYTITLDANGGTGGTATLYYDATSGDTAFFDATSAAVSSVTIPTYTGNSFLGYYTEQSGGTQVIAANGTISAHYAPTGNETIYAHWGIDVSVITVEAGEGTGGASRFWHRGSTGKFYADAELTTEITAITMPTIRLFSTLGAYSGASGGTQLVAANGTISASWHPTEEFVTVYARYSRNCYEVAISPSVGEVAAIYRAPDGSTFYREQSLTTAITNVGAPVRSGYTFGGFVYVGATVIDASGNILSAAVHDEDYTATATWTANTYTLTFNASGGTASFASKQVTYGQQIGNLPTATYSGRVFDEWRINGDGITSATIYTIAGNATAVAKWETSFGDVEDYFRLGDSALVPESSDSGETKPRVVAYNATSEAPATEDGPAWLNPRVTYRVVAQKSLSVTLGRAYASGFMITSVEVSTSIGEAPVVTVNGVANEGKDAINTYAVSLSVSPRHRPQNLMSAVSGGGQLQQLTLRASCDPVVVAENNRPVASDVVHGRIEVSAVTGAYNAESAPSPNNGFVSVGTALQRSGVGYKFWNINARKELS